MEVCAWRVDRRVAAIMLMFCFNLLTSFGLGEPGKLMAQGAIIALAAMAYAARGAPGGA